MNIDDENYNKKIKIIKCYFCNNEVEVKLKGPNEIVCNECKNKGLITPKNKIAIEKMRNTLKEKYGVNNISKLESVNKKRAESYLKTYKNKGKEILEKQIKTKEERYGKEWKKVINKLSEEGMLKKHGVKRSLQIKEIFEKQKNTMIDRYGECYTMYVDELKDRQKNSFIKNLGVTNPLKSDSIKKKINDTNLKKYGVKWPTESLSIREKIKQTYLNNFTNKMLLALDYLNYELVDPPYRHAGYNHKFKCKTCNFIIEKCWNYIQQGFLCPICYPRNPSYSSVGENQVKEYIKLLGFQTIQNDRSLIYPFELDILIPSKKLAIEYNGLYYHTINNHENMKYCNDPRRYHVNKLNLCKEKDYTLITIFEDEWIYKKDIVKSRLKHILNVSNNQKIHGRKCIIKEIDSKTKNEFLNKYHIQGRDNSTIKLGAFYNDELVSVMTFSYGNISKGSKKENGVWELNRFCSNYNYHIPGIASKLLEYFKRNYEWEKIFSYADLRWSNGNLYFKLGFQTDNIKRLNYWYVKDLKRIHRFQLKKNQNDPKGISEQILRTKEGYGILWDCGNLKFILKNRS